MAANRNNTRLGVRSGVLRVALAASGFHPLYNVRIQQRTHCCRTVRCHYISFPRSATWKSSMANLNTFRYRMETGNYNTETCNTRCADCAPAVRDAYHTL